MAEYKTTLVRFTEFLNSDKPESYLKPVLTSTEEETRKRAYDKVVEFLSDDCLDNDEKDEILIEMLISHFYKGDINVCVHLAKLLKLRQSDFFHECELTRRSRILRYVTSNDYVYHLCPKKRWSSELALFVKQYTTFCPESKEMRINDAAWKIVANASTHAREEHLKWAMELLPEFDFTYLQADGTIRALFNHCIQSSGSALVVLDNFHKLGIPYVKNFVLSRLRPSENFTRIIYVILAALKYGEDLSYFIDSYSTSWSEVDKIEEKNVTILTEFLTRMVTEDTKENVRLLAFLLSVVTNPEVHHGCAWGKDINWIYNTCNLLLRADSDVITMMSSFMRIVVCLAYGCRPDDVIHGNVDMKTLPKYIEPEKTTYLQYFEHKSTKFSAGSATNQYFTGITKFLHDVHNEHNTHGFNLVTEVILGMKPNDFLDPQKFQHLWAELTTLWEWFQREYC